MGIYLNTNKPLENYKRLLNTEYFVDKSMIIEKTNKIINTAIREKEYVEKIRRENEGKKVLAVAICYDSKNKEHRCKIEEI